MKYKIGDKIHVHHRLYPLEGYKYVILSSEREGRDWIIKNLENGHISNVDILWFDRKTGKTIKLIT